MIAKIIETIVMTIIYVVGAYLVSSFLRWDLSWWEGYTFRAALFISAFIAYREAFKPKKD
ncbi:MAG: hypothetical protein ACUZ8H_15515 [Candidatus Anammoxibacter sp.]